MCVTWNKVSFISTFMSSWSFFLSRLVHIAWFSFLKAHIFITIMISIRNWRAFQVIKIYLYTFFSPFYGWIVIALQSSIFTLSLNILWFFLEKKNEFLIISVPKYVAHIFWGFAQYALIKNIFFCKTINRSFEAFFYR